MMYSLATDTAYVWRVDIALLLRYGIIYCHGNVRNIYAMLMQACYVYETRLHRYD